MKLNNNILLMMKPWDPCQKVFGVMLLVLFSNSCLLAQTIASGSQKTNTGMRESIKYDRAINIKRGLARNAASLDLNLDSVKISQRPLKLNIVTGGQIREVSDSLRKGVGASLKTEISSGNWNKIYTATKTKNEN